MDGNGLTGPAAKQRRALFFREMEKWLERTARDDRRDSMRNALIVMARRRGVPMTDVCEFFGLHRASAAGVVRRERVDDPRDEWGLTWVERAANCLLVQGFETSWSSGVRSR